jgi:hypothetical protein
LINALICGIRLTLVRGENPSPLIVAAAGGVRKVLGRRATDLLVTDLPELRPFRVAVCDEDIDIARPPAGSDPAPGIFSRRRRRQQHAGRGGGIPRTVV